MKLIRANFEILSNINSKKILKSIEIAGRTCYKSENKITKNSAKEFIKMIIKRGHESVLEHEKITIKFICDRGVSHELVRHRLASFSQESTRYCNYSKDKFDNQLIFIIPNWLNLSEGIYNSVQDVIKKHNLINDNNTIGLYSFCLFNSENNYNNLINKYKWKPQQARSVLPNSLKTEIVITANLREWRLIFKQRTSTLAHPQMRELMCPLLDKLKQQLPIIFDDIKY